MNEPDEIPSVEAVIEDPASSYWLKSTVRSALMRDPADALNDALLLTALLDRHLRNVLELDPAG